MTALRLLPAVCLALATSTSIAQPAGAPPVPPNPMAISETIDVVRGAEPVTAYVQARATAIAGCIPKNKTDVRTRISLRWNRGGKLTTIDVSGGNAAYNRCVRAAVRGTIGATRRGSGQILLVAHRRGPAPIPSTPPAPAPIVTAQSGHPDLTSCKVDSDCTLYFQTSSCVPSDPIAVNTVDPAAVRKAFPPRRIECAMGGPQYDRLRMSQENRYATRCEQRQCVLIDHGAQPAGPGDLLGG
ncbi:MAG: hypothetical protein K8W52_20915 [Deltaproteobacteria bacterium]|nr:hypothetical protein [Deltaproteobacteria bacterium]